MAKIIELFRNDEPGKVAEFVIEGRKLIDNMSGEDRKKIYMAALYAVADEYMKGCNGEPNPVYDLIDDISMDYEDKTHPCYFNFKTDPNGQEFNPENSRLCLECGLKVANILKYVGVDPGFVIVGESFKSRKVQQAQIDWESVDK